MADIYDFLNELAQLDIEYIARDNKPYLLKSYIRRLEEHKILIAPPEYNGNAYNLPEGNMVGVGVHSEKGVYLGECRVVGKDLSDIQGVWISYPTGMQVIQRREYLRIPLRLECQFIIYQDGFRKNKKVLNLYTRDISGSGFSCISDEPLPQYFDLEAKINFNDEENVPIVSRCEHIYSEIMVIDDERKCINAFAFIDIKQVDVERIVKASFKYQLGRLRLS